MPDQRELEIDLMQAQQLALDIVEMCKNKKVGMLAMSFSMLLAHFARTYGGEPVVMIEAVTIRAVAMLQHDAQTTEKPTVN